MAEEAKFTDTKSDIKKAQEELLQKHQRSKIEHPALSHVTYLNRQGKGGED